MDKEKSISLVLRLGLAFSLLYAGISIFYNPTDWIGFVPQWVRELSGGGYLSLYGHACFDILLGLWLLSNKWTFYASILTALNLFSISLFNLSQLDIIFRDVSLIFMALALAILSKKNS